jgi:hypothetical protein
MKRIDIQILQPIVRNETLNVQEALSVQFRNVGNTDATIDGNLTLRAGEVFALGGGENCVFSKRLVIKFNTGVHQKIEVILTKYV